MSKDGAMPWVKIYTDILDDSKVGNLNDACKLRFIQLVVLAGECDAEGALVKGDQPMTIAEIGRRLRVRADKLARELAAIERETLIYSRDNCWFISKFAARQGRSQSEKREYWREKQRENRAKRESVNVDSIESQSNVNAQSREEKRREEEEKNDCADAPLPHPSSALQNPQTGSATSLEANQVTAQTIAPDPPHEFQSEASIAGEATTAKKKRTKAPKNEDADANPEHQALFTAIAECCRLDPRLMGGRIGKAAKELWHAVHATPAQVETFRSWWFANDWRGQKGSAPSLSQLSEFWQQAIDAATGGAVFAKAGNMRKGESAGDIAIRRLAERYGNGQQS